MTQKGRNSLLQVAIILFVLALPALFAPDSVPLSKVFYVPFARRDLYCNLISILFFYANYKGLVEEYYNRGKTAIFVSINGIGLFLILLITAYFTFRDYSEDILLNPPSEFGKFEHAGHFLFDASHSVFLYVTGILSALMLVTNQRLRRIELEKSTTELNLLKMQMQPHFLFNTLNSIYSLALERAPETADAIVRLASIMRYSITEAHNEKVLMETELDYITNYVELQKLRIGPETSLDFEVSGEAGSKKVAPMLLLSFIENAFKYGSNPDRKSHISISIHLSENEVILTVVNDKVVNLKPEYNTTGLGIMQARQQLELLYAGKHQLDILDEETRFTVTLKIIC